MAEPTLQDLAELLRPFQEGGVTHIATFPCREKGQPPGTRLLQHQHPQVRAVAALAEELLIAGSQPDYPAMRELTRLCGVTVGPGERDSFGWLSGCIHTNSGTIVYG